MDSNFYLFFELLAFVIFFYSVNKDNWQVMFIFLSTALFLPLSIASYDIEKTFVLYNSGSGEIQKFIVSNYDNFCAYLNMGMGLLSIAIGLIRSISYKEILKSNDE